MSAAMIGSQEANQTMTQFDTQYTANEVINRSTNQSLKQPSHTSHIQSHNHTINTINHPIHPSPVFIQPTNHSLLQSSNQSTTHSTNQSINQSTTQSTNQPVRLPLIYDGDQQPFKRSAESIGFSRNEQLSENMNLSLGWAKSGDLTDWSKKNPYAVRDERDRAARSLRGEVIDSVIDYTPQWQKDLPPFIMPVPAPTKRSNFPNILLAASDQTCSEMFEQSESALALKALIEKRAADRSKAKAMIDECATWEPFATGDSQFFVPEPSGYTEYYHDTSKGGPEKVALIQHPAESYVLDRQDRDAYRGKNQRWTEERLFFRGYHTSDDYDPDDPNTHKTASASSADLLFDAPLYSSFSSDKIFHEPQVIKKNKVVKLTKVKAPRMSSNQSISQSSNQSSRPSSQPSDNDSPGLSVLADNARQEESKEMYDQSPSQSASQSSYHPKPSPSPLHRLQARQASLPIATDVIVPCITMPHRPVVRFISSTMLPMQKPRNDTYITTSSISTAAVTTAQLSSQ